MSNRYELVNFLNTHDEFRDNDKGVKFDSFEVVRTLNHYWNLLNEQDQKIKELEHRLSNCIEPKFKINNTIFVIVNDNIEEYFVDEILLRNKGTLWAYYDICKKTEITEKNEIFATEAEAKKHLEDLKK